MKNKKNIYILLSIVLLVWGGVLYQFFSLTNTNQITPSEKEVYSIKPLQIIKKQTFSINVNYRDPFLGKMYIPENIAKRKIKSSKSNKNTMQKKTLVWPTILYKGIISDTKDKKKIFILIIEGKNHFMKIGDTENDVYLKTGDKECVYVKYKGNLNLIMLQD